MGSKYGAVPTDVDGIRFASKAEARRYGELSLMEYAGEIHELELQPAYDLVVNGVKIGKYVADFRYVLADTGAVVVEDVKGGNATKTPVYRLKAKLVRALYGVEISEVAA